jgi:hypothetical protein
LPSVAARCRGQRIGSFRSQGNGPLERRSSCVVIQWRLAALVSHLLADVGDLGAHLEHHPLNGAAGRVAGRTATDSSGTTIYDANARNVGSITTTKLQSR